MLTRIDLYFHRLNPRPFHSLFSLSPKILRVFKMEDLGRRLLCGGEMIYGVDISVLPEGSIAAVISFTSPRDACRFASVSKMFQSAADSDSVWDRFLPSDYVDILRRSDGGLSLLDSLSKKNLFMSLADTPLLIDGGTKSFSLEKSTGKKCYTIAARDLSIAWGGTPTYWAWHSVPESRFPEVAELVRVCWLEIKGKMRTSLLSPDTSYAAYLVFKLASEAYGFYAPAEVVVKTSGGKTETQNVYLDPEEPYQRWRQPTEEREGDRKLPKQRGDGWLEIAIGEFSTCRDEDGEVEMSLSEVKALNWKRGLLVEGIEIRPKMVTE